MTIPLSVAVVALTELAGSVEAEIAGGGALVDVVVVAVVVDVGVAVVGVVVVVVVVVAAATTGEGKSKREIIRCLKRYTAREVYNTLRADLAELQPHPPRATTTILCGSPGFGITRKRT